MSSCGSQRGEKKERGGKVKCGFHMAGELQRVGEKKP